ncbi:MAG: phosphomannomutase/phosphoglucomutase [bacterium]|nr:phosphomannomutase/phosphoglucomutase [bacterium]
MSALDPHIFRAYDIRGHIGDQITNEACELIGKAFGSTVREMYDMEHPRIAVGGDARTHTPEFEDAVIRGLVSTGCHVLHIGQTPSPINYFTICDQGLDGGMQVTASHNPKDDNGIKLQVRDAVAHSGDNIQTLRKRIDAESFITGEGKVEEYDAVHPYIDHITTMFAGVGEGLTIGLDTGNGVAGPVYKDVLEKIGCTVTGLYIEPDGTFPNHPADPSKAATLKDLQESVQTNDLDIGLGFDGDGDRLGLVDEHGDVRSADEAILLLAKDHLSRNPGKPVVFTVSNSGALESEITKWGGRPVMCIVGHSFVEHAMTHEGALLGGEQSGHFFCGEDYYPYDDALVAALRILKIVSSDDRTLSEMCAEFPTVYQAQELRPHCDDGEKEKVIAAVTKNFQKDFPVETMDGGRIDFGDDAWAGIRQSNTSPCLSICLEARSPEKLEEITDLVMKEMSKYPEVSF